jgi:hypothetical protein
MVIKGTVYEILPLNNVSEKFTKQEIVVQSDQKYPQYLTIQFAQDNLKLLDGIRQGDSVEVVFEVRGNKWLDKKTGKEKFFNSLQGHELSLQRQNNRKVELVDKDEDPF